MHDVSPVVETLLLAAVQEAKRAHSRALEPIHAVVALLRSPSPQIAEVLTRLGLPIERLVQYGRRIADKGDGSPRPQRISHRLTMVLSVAQEQADEDRRELDSAHILAALLIRQDRDVRTLVEAKGIPVAELVPALRGAGKHAIGTGRGRDSGSNRSATPGTPALDRFGKDYTALGRAGKFEPLIGRRSELKQLVRVLLRKQKSNAILVGPPGVGKTRLVEGLATFAAAPNAPAALGDLRIVELMTTSLVAGASHRGEFEERLEAVVKEVESSPNVVVFLDEIHTLVRVGASSGSADAANLLKPALSRGTFRCIGATTSDEYSKHLENDAAFARRFQPIRVEEPSPEEALEILRGLQAGYEAHHRCSITDEALEAAVRLSVRHIPERRLPDKARDLVDQAAANKRFLTLSPQASPPADPTVTPDDIAQVVADWTGIPVTELTSDERARLLRMEDALRNRVIGQDSAVTIVAEAVRTAHAGLARADRPYGSFLFVGPSGVGKTELARALAEFLFGTSTRLVRFDMSEFMEEHSVAKLIGSPPGYVGHQEGGQLTEAIRATPYAVVLLDEIEKAHRRIADLLLQVLDEGQLTDARGRVADFRSTIVILTSNLGAALPSAERKRRVGFALHDDLEGSREPVADAKPSSQLRRELLGHFRPELLNRIDNIVQFRSLEERDAQAILQKLMRRVSERLAERGIALRISPESEAALARAGLAPECGVRGMEQLVERAVIQPIARGLLEGVYGAGVSVEVTCDSHGVRLSTGARYDAPHASTQTLGPDTVVHSQLHPSASESAALLLVQIEASAHLLKNRGDTVFQSEVHRLYAALQSHPASNEASYLKCTGDGFLATFGRVERALDLARMLCAPGSPDSVRLRALIHWGRIKVGPGGDPIGAEVHRLFEISASRTPRPHEAEIHGPAEDRVAITRAAVDQLPSSRRQTLTRAGDLALPATGGAIELWLDAN